MNNPPSSSSSSSPKNSISEARAKGAIIFPAILFDRDRQTELGYIQIFEPNQVHNNLNSIVSQTIKIPPAQFSIFFSSSTNIQEKVLITRKAKQLSHICKEQDGVFHVILKQPRNAPIPQPLPHQELTLDQKVVRRPKKSAMPQTLVPQPSAYNGVFGEGDFPRMQQVYPKMKEGGKQQQQQQPILLRHFCQECSSAKMEKMEKNKKEKMEEEEEEVEFHPCLNDEVVK